MKNFRDQIFRRRLSFLVAVIVVAVIIVISGSSVASAKSNSEQKKDKYYKSIIIEEGDTLWSIAEEYKSSEYASTEEYVNELIQMNGLRSDKIHTGNNLVVTYYSSTVEDK